MIRKFFQNYVIYVFVALTFGITWTIGATAMFAPDWFKMHFDSFNTSSPIFYLEVLAPDIASVAITLPIGTE
jgi:hypothetical protein